MEHHNIIMVMMTHQSKNEAKKCDNQCGKKYVLDGGTLRADEKELASEGRRS